MGRRRFAHPIHEAIQAANPPFLLVHAIRQQPPVGGQQPKLLHLIFRRLQRQEAPHRFAIAARGLQIVNPCLFRRRIVHFISPSSPVFPGASIV